MADDDDGPAAVTSATASVSPSSVSVPVPDLTRLPKDIVPKRYELKMDVDPLDKKYKGLVNIRLYFNAEETTVIWLHASKNVNIVSAHLRFSQFGELPVEAAEVIFVPDSECIGIRFITPIKEGTRAWLGIHFKGDISDGMQGLFSAPYLDKNGERQLGAATMFAATEARTCFPCFDEPEFKAVFALEITVDDHLTVISNMPVMDSTYSVKKPPDVGKRKRTDFFEWTKEMSTYLVCFVIGQYEYLETKAGDHGRTRVRVYTPWGQREQGRFGLQVAKKSLEFFNDYFATRYPLPKLDLVALSRLSVGAMENWGVITCREAGLITDDKDSDPYTLQRVATLIAHEISHQWFGNLVTMKWWDGLYLNEGFATLMQYMCIDKIFPEYKVFNKFCSETVMPALGLDALQNSHPIEMPLNDAREIAQVFDYITYSKGASVLFMLHEFIGAKIFKEALQEYMEDFSYNNAKTEDLWGVLSAQSKKDVGAIMSSWIRELGFPIVTVAVSREPVETPGGELAIELTQERFSSFSDSKTNMVWNIPLRGIYMTKSGKLAHFDVLFDTPQTRVILADVSLEHPDCWLKLNPGMIGFYRVQYDEKLFERLLKNLNCDHLSAIDRISLFDDQIAMVLSSKTSTTVRLLQMIELVKDFETSVTVWKTVIGSLQQIRTLTWDSEELANLFDQFCLDILRSVLDRTGVHPKPDESDNDTMLRATVFSMLASLGDSMVLGAASEMFRMHLDEVGSIPSSLRGPVFKAVMTQATPATFNQMLMLYRQAELAEDRVSVLAALGCAEDPNVLTRALEFSISDEVEPQESISTIVAAAANRSGFKLTWTFFVQNMDRLTETYLGSLFMFGRLVKSITQCFTAEESGNNVVDFFADNEDRFEAQCQAVQQAVEHVKFNQIWRNQDAGKIHKFLDQYFNS